MHTTIEEEKPDILKEIMNLTSVSDVKFFEETNNVNTEIKKNQLRLITEIFMEGKFIRNGTILSSGEFILSTRYRRNEECFMYNKCGELTKKIESLSRPFDIIEIESNKEIIVSCSDSKYLKLFDNYYLTSKKSLKLSKEPFCIAWLFSKLFVTNDDKIIKMNKEGGVYKRFKTGTSVKHITCTSHAHHQT